MPSFSAKRTMPSPRQKIDSYRARVAISRERRGLLNRRPGILRLGSSGDWRTAHSARRPASTDVSKRRMRAAGTCAAAFGVQNRSNGASDVVPKPEEPRPPPPLYDPPLSSTRPGKLLLSRCLLAEKILAAPADAARGALRSSRA